MVDTRAAVTFAAHGPVAVIEIDSPPVNALGAAVRRGIEADIAQAIADPAIRAIIIACAGRTFCAGADIAEFGKPFEGPELNAVLAAIEASPKPVVAALHGTVLGGGLELALATHRRVADPDTKLGLPEVNLGLLPGAGGTQRLPRIVGPEKAIDMIAGGKPIGASAAHSIGLVDALSEPGGVRDAAIALASELSETDIARVSELPVTYSAEDVRSAAGAFRQRQPGLFKGFKAARAIMDAIEASATMPFVEGLAREGELFRGLLASEESRAQRHLFFAERAVAKIPDVDPATRALPIEHIGVIGAGTMGTGIAIAFLSAGFKVDLVDASGEALQRAQGRIEKTIRSAAAKGRMSENAADEALAGFRTAADIEVIGKADLIVEAVFEQLEIKRTVFATLDRLAKPGAILASNTSFLDLNEIAAATSRPEAVVGLHFFAPANVMRLLEVVRGARTADAVLTTAMKLGRRLGKIAVLSGVCDGFIANRLMARRGEVADRLLLEGPSAAEIDGAMTDYGFPMGVFQMLDLVGLDVIGWDRETSAGRTVQEILCEAGHWGQKTGSGYYAYEADGRVNPSPVAAQAVSTVRKHSGIPQKRYSAAALLHELLDPIVNEGARTLEEGIALRASDIDLALVAGYGWPAYTGGPMCWGDRVGLANVVERLERRIANGEAITLSPLLVRHAREGLSFTPD